MCFGQISDFSDDDDDDNNSNGSNLQCDMNNHDSKSKNTIISPRSKYICWKDK